MRTDTVSIGGKSYQVKGLSVSQSLQTDLEAYDARLAKDRKALSDIRLRRIAYSLQNGGAYIPDAASPIDPETGEHKGQMAASSMTVEAVMKWLDSDVFADMEEFYDVEKKTLALADRVKSNEPRTTKGAKEAEGETTAPGL